MSATIDGAVSIRKNDGPFLDIGFGFMVNVDRITSIVPFAGKAVHNLYYDKRREGKVFDATRGRKKLSVIVLVDGTLISSAYYPDTIANRQI